MGKTFLLTRLRSGDTAGIIGLNGTSNGGASMKIFGTTEVGNSSSIKKKKKAEGDSGFGSLLASKLEEKSESTPVMSLNNVDALFALQEISEDEENSRKGVLYGESLLNALDTIRHGLLAGAISRHNLEQLGTLVQQQRTVIIDPKLRAILDEIEVRAAVELAKLERQG
ncbi:MAG: flagellar assembly protein FliX [Alphaproteobacteria bacterium]|nr:flagellar assembly protein FliX [Alphaproteobacteria bacterium]